MKYDANGYIQVAVAASDLAEVIDDRVDALIQDGTDITWTYVDASGTLTAQLDTTRAGPEVITGGLTLGLNGAGGAAGSLTLLDGANPGDDETLTYAKWNSLNDTSGVVQCNGSGTFSAATDVTSLVTAATTSAAGKVELAIASEVTTGTSTSLAVTPDALAGSGYGKRIMVVDVVNPLVALSAGTGQRYVPVPADLHGWNIISTQHQVYTVSSGAAPALDIQRLRYTAGAGAASAVSIFTTAPTIDAGEFTTLNATTAESINASNASMSANATASDVLRFDVTTAGTSTAGWTAIVVFQLP